MPVLAEASDYFAPWQLAVAAVLVVVWIVWGGRLMRSAVQGDVGRKEGQLNRCFIITVLAGIVGVVCAGMAAALAYILAKSINVQTIWLALPAMAVVFCLVSYLTIFSAFQLPVGKISKVWVKSFGPPIAVAVLAAIPTVWLANSYRQQKMAQYASMNDFHQIYKAIASQYMPARPPQSLEELVTLNVVQAKYLVAKRHPSRKIGYFYRPGTLQAMEQATKKLLACDWKDNLSGGYRVVLFTNGKIELENEAQFKQLLADDVNKEFAEALAKAEKALPAD